MNEQMYTAAGHGTIDNGWIASTPVGRQPENRVRVARLVPTQCVRLEAHSPLLRLHLQPDATIFGEWMAAFLRPNNLGA